MIETNLAKTLSAAGDSGLDYDTNIKHLLADKQILSYGYTEAEYVEAERSLFVNP